MTIVDDAIEADLAALERVVDPPLEPLGYGVDLSCVTDVTTDLAEVSPMSRAAIGEALVRRLITPRGSLLDDGDYGFDIRGWCNRGVDDRSVRELGARIRAELTKDDRVDDIAVTVSYSAPTSTLDVKIFVTPLDPIGDGFELVFAVSDTTALLSSITPPANA